MRNAMDVFANHYWLQPCHGTYRKIRVDMLLNRTRLFVSDYSTLACFGSLTGDTFFSNYF